MSDARAARLERAAGFAAILGVAAGVIVAAARKLGDFDLPWHLALGRAAIARRALPFNDDFSFTQAGKRAPDEFLSDVVLYLCARIGGAFALQLLAAIAIALLAWLLTRRARPAAWPIGCAFAALALMAAGPWFVVRPALLSFVCLAAFLAIIDGHRLSQAPLWRLIPLQILWSNVHPFAVLGPLLVLAYAGYALVCRALASRGGGTLFPAADGNDLARTMFIAVVVCAAACVSPLGWRLYVDPFVIAHDQPLITEWTRTSLDFLVRYDLPLLILALFTIVALIGSRPRVNAFDLALVLMAMALSMMAVRLIALGAIIAAPLAARMLAPRLVAVRMAPLLVALLGIATAPVLAATPGMTYGIGFDERNVPEGATRFIAAHHPAGALFNFLPFGGWLTWRLYPDVRVFIDGRTARLYPVPFFTRYAAAEHDPKIFAALADEYDLQWAVVRSRPGETFSEPIARDRRFVMVYLDDCAAVYVRRDGPNAALAHRGYTLLRHLTPPPMGPVPPAFVPALRHDAALAVTQDPRSPRARALARAASAASME